MKLKILEIKQELNNCFSLILEKPIGFHFYPGQFLDIELDIQDYDKRGKVRAFTISSSSTEDFLMLTPKKGISDFKKAIEKLKPGDSIETSHPAGTFILDETTPAVFIAGGVGITPFRSILKYALDDKLSTPITLIYTTSSDQFLFKSELELWQRKLANLQIIFWDSRAQGRINKQYLERITTPDRLDAPIYYLAGSHSMILAFSKYLAEMGVDEVNIRTDAFDGY